MQSTWLSEISPKIRKYSRAAATYEAYFSHRVPASATMKYSERALTDMLHNAIVTGQPGPAFRDCVPTNSVRANMTLPPRPREHREMFRDWYLKDCS